MTDRIRPNDEVELEERIHRHGRLLAGLPCVEGEPIENAVRRGRYMQERWDMEIQLKALITKREST